MAATKDVIVELSKLPISIIIVGIGDSPEFTKMEELDSDDQLLRGNYGTAERDVVQFVPFNQFKHDPS